MKKSILAVAVWYFVVFSFQGGVAQIGPFATQAACDAFRTNLQQTLETSISCFSTAQSKKPKFARC